MSLRFTVLASGSGGNASLLEIDGFGVLIDAGLGPRQLARRLAACGASWHPVQAVLLTHTHGDHWRERTLAFLLRQGIPVYCHAAHADALDAESTAFRELQQQRLVNNYCPGKLLELHRRLSFVPTGLSHDGICTCGFRFYFQDSFWGKSHSLAYAADLGCWDRSLLEFCQDVDILALEFNHDVEMERTSGRSPLLIARVLGAQGHLSNEQACALVEAVLRHSTPGRLQHLVQLHLSRDCNRPALARAAAKRLLADFPHFRIHTARQDRPGPCLHLGKSPAPAAAAARVQQPWLPGWE